MLFCHPGRVFVLRSLEKTVVKMFSRRSTQEGARSSWQKLSGVLLRTALISVVVHSAIQTYRLEGASMEPSLSHGQCLIVNKFIYHLLHPPQRGDIILLKDPRRPDREVIKRVIGLPGEKVTVSQGQVYINAGLLNEPYISSPGAYAWGPSIVRQGQYFVLGDNRSNSRDSLSWGWLPAKDIIGRAWISYWPLPARRL